jgi:hypothetical protein
MIHFMKPEIIRLNLLQPLLYYADSESNPWEAKDSSERLFCFELELSQALEFQPDKKNFPGSLVFAGKALGGRDAAVPTALADERKAFVHAENPQGCGFSALELPAGVYLFTQVREILAQDEIINLAIEVQNEGLWQRLKLNSRYYLRFLSEDGRPVTQIFRPYAKNVGLQP